MPIRVVCGWYLAVPRCNQCAERALSLSKRAPASSHESSEDGRGKMCESMHVGLCVCVCVRALIPGQSPTVLALADMLPPITLQSPPPPPNTLHVPQKAKPAPLRRRALSVRAPIRDGLDGRGSGSHTDGT